MATAADLVAEIVSAHGVSEEVALRTLNRRHKKMVARSKMLRKPVAVGNTVAGQAFYAVDVIEMLSFEVDGVPYTKARRPDRYAYSRGTLLWAGPGGLIIADADAAGVQGVSIIPTPTSVVPIVAFAVVAADDLEEDSTIVVDDDFHDALVEGATATILAREDESEAAADRYEARFDEACEELRRRVVRRFRGSGPTQIRVAGINA